MSKEAPILQRIHARLDRVDRRSLQNNHLLSEITIQSFSHGYTITTFPENGELNRLRFSIQAKGGIFGGSGPQLIETSADGGVTMRSDKKTHEMVLPGMPGFELFEQLHQSLQGLRGLSVWTARLIDPSLEGICPVIFNYKKVSEVEVYARKNEATLCTNKVYEIFSKDDRKVKVELAIEEKGVSSSKDITEPRSDVIFGKVKISDKVSEKELSDDVLSEFGFMNDVIKKLYR